MGQTASSSDEDEPKAAAEDDEGEGELNKARRRIEALRAEAKQLLKRRKRAAAVALDAEADALERIVQRAAVNNVKALLVAGTKRPAPDLDARLAELDPPRAPQPRDLLDFVSAPAAPQEEPAQSNEEVKQSHSDWREKLKALR